MRTVPDNKVIFIIIAAVNVKPMTSNVCPAIMFAKSRIERLKGLKKYEITSIAISIGASPVGDPAGKNALNRYCLWLRIPIIITPMKMAKAILKVLIHCPVIASENGINPRAFVNRINENRKKIKEKKVLPLLPIFLYTKAKTN